MKKFYLACGLLCAFNLPAAAVEFLPVPADIKPFIPKRQGLIFLKSADLNKDGRLDRLLVLQKNASQEDEEADDHRELQILIQGADGKLTLAKRGPHVILCQKCGGVMGDPFQDIEVKGATFKIMHYGGSRYRWSYETTFGYSRIDNTWQLTTVKMESDDIHQPKAHKEKTYKPPRDFGKIAIGELNLEDFLNKLGSKK